MAPAFNPGIDYESLIYQNCRVFLALDVELKVVTQYDSSKRWHAHVLKTENGKRTAALSESSKSAAQALELLHEKSAIAVDQYVAANGFALPLQFSTRSSHSGGEDTPRSVNGKDASNPLENSEVIALCGSSSSEASDSEDSEKEFMTFLATRRRKSRPAGQAASLDRFRAEIFDDSPRPRHQTLLNDSRGRTSVYPSHPVPISAPVPGMGTIVPPPPKRVGPPFQPPQVLPPRGWERPFPTKSSGRIPYPPPPMHPIQRIPSYNFPPPPPLKAFSQVPVKLNIEWPGHGNQKCLVRSVPTKQAISRVALKEVQERQAELFPEWGFTATAKSRLKATIETVLIGDQSYDVKTFGNDFSSLCGDGKPILGVDIVIKESGPSHNDDSGSDDVAVY